MATTYELDLPRWQRRIREADINEEMRTAIMDFDRHHGINIRPATRIHYLKCLRIFAIEFKDKPPNHITKNDIAEFFDVTVRKPRHKPDGSYEPLGYRVVEQIKIAVKRFFKEYYKSENYPEAVGWLKAKKSTKPAVTKEDLLTSEEIKKMIQFADSPREKAFIMLLAETACRPEELFNMKVKDIKFSDDITSIEVDGKTYFRKVPIIHSVPYLRDWLNVHPKPEPDSYLWVCTGPKHRGEKVRSAPMKARIKKIAERAGIKKRVYCYLFRHTQLTELVKSGYSELYLKKHAGWTGSSKMAEVYVHLAFDDIGAKYLEINGMMPKQAKKENALKSKVCPKCNTLNHATNKMCSNCFYIIDLQTAMEQEEKRKRMDDLMDMLMSRPRIKEAFQDELAQIERERQ